MNDIKEQAREYAKPSTLAWSHGQTGLHLLALATLLFLLTAAVMYDRTNGVALSLNITSSLFALRLVVDVVRQISFIILFQHT